VEFRHLIRRRTSRLAAAFARAIAFAFTALAFAALALVRTGYGAGESAGSAPRVEARSADLLAVGLVQGDRMIIHLSHVLDNAPLRDAVVNVALRGATHPTVAEADGSYTLVSKDLALPGTAAVEFQVTQSELHETLKGVLQVAAPSTPADDRSNGRQMWWWALNFGVCIGFLVLISRRKKSAQT
jgi:hypothetical protein